MNLSEKMLSLLTLLNDLILSNASNPLCMEISQSAINDKSYTIATIEYGILPVIPTVQKPGNRVCWIGCPLLKICADGTFYRRAILEEV